MSSHNAPLAEIIAHEVQKYHAFINLALFLSMLTSAEIILIFLPFSYGVLATTLVTLSVIKFFCVIFWFMHLIYDAPLLAYIFISGILFALGTILALIFMSDPADLDRSRYAWDMALNAARWLG